MKVLGIDPGISGAAVLVAGDGSLVVRRDFQHARDIVAAILELAPQATHSVMEFVHAQPGEGVCSVFAFGRYAGTAWGALVACGLEPVEVPPQVWQRFYKKRFELPRGPFKLFTIEAAKRVFPGQAHLFSRKKDHGTADAALLAEFFRLNPRYRMKSVLT